VKGRLRLRLRGDETGCTEVDLEEGEFFIVPRGVEHQPVADDEVHVMLFEPAGTRNTGNVQNDHTLADLERL
jgi:mannose-6-phosphate isomerase-like protein (cupin superfamily)